MSITSSASGTVTNADLLALSIRRDGTGNLTAVVQYRMTNAAGVAISKQASWTLSAAEKSAVVDELLPGAKTAVSDALGL